MQGNVIGVGYQAQHGGDIRISGEAKVGARSLEVPEQIEALARTLKGCAQGLSTLEDRLNMSILRPAVPAPTSVEANGQPSCNTGTGVALQTLVREATQANERIQSIIARLEA